MKILYLNGADIEGGAAKAATRLLQGVHAQAAGARLYAQRKYGDDPSVDGPRSLFGKVLGLARPSIEQLLFGLTPGNMKGPFCVAFLPDGLLAQVSSASPDILHLHWVARMLRLETLRRITVPIVWTLHDSWAFTGGCYLPGDCTRYQQSCGACPVLGSARENDLSHRVWRRKEKAWDGLNLTIIAPSRWMAACARSSSLFRDTRIEVIPNGIDVQIYKPVEKHAAREHFSLPHDKKLILFGAKSATLDRNKGFHLYKEALRELTAIMKNDQVELVFFGSAEPDKFSDLCFKAHYLGWQNDDTSLSQLYSAADVFVLPSIQESLGYTVMEAMACGTPSVAFRQGGVPDLIDHRHNGYLAQPYEPSDLAGGIGWIMEDKNRWEELSCNARRKIENVCAIEKVAKRHLELYREIKPT
jgi:glycosyltransferase involved in cell wall biosynthesis